MRYIIFKLQKIQNKKIIMKEAGEKKPLHFNVNKELLPTSLQKHAIKKSGVFKVL